MKKRRKGRDGREAPELDTTRVPRPLMKKVRIIADHRDINIDEAWAIFAGPGIDAEFDRCVGEMSQKPKRAG